MKVGVQARPTRTLVCPDCGSSREVEYRTWWAAMKRPAPGRCRPCTFASIQERTKTRAAVALAGGTKICRGCDRELPPDAFYVAANHSDGLATYCKECSRTQARDWYTDNRQRSRAASDEWKRRNPLAWRSISHNSYGLSRDPDGEKIDHAAVLEEHGWVCHICREPIGSLKDLAFDHVQSFANGGRHITSNVLPSHFVCNARKGAMEDKPCA